MMDLIKRFVWLMDQYIRFVSGIFKKPTGPDGEVCSRFRCIDNGYLISFWCPFRKISLDGFIVFPAFEWIKRSGQKYSRWRFQPGFINQKPWRNRRTGQLLFIDEKHDQWDDFSGFRVAESVVTGRFYFQCQCRGFSGNLSQNSLNHQRA